MRSIAVINQKGGVGKTATAVHLAAALARVGQRTLLVDLDPQAHASLHVGVQLGPQEPSLYDVLCRVTPLAEICRDVGERFTLAPASIDLVGVELELGERDDRERLLAGALEAYRRAFDFCIVDCPPSLGLLTVNALAAVREILLPLQAHFLALQGLGRLFDTVSLARRALNPELRVSGVVICLYEKNARLTQEVIDDVSRFLAAAGPADPWWGARVLDTRIRRNIKLAECPSFGQTVFDYAPASHGTEDYLALAREVLALSPPAAAAAGVSAAAVATPAGGAWDAAPP